MNFHQVVSKCATTIFVSTLHDKPLSILVAPVGKEEATGGEFYDFT